jgi:hypothetical protein
MNQLLIIIYFGFKDHLLKSFFSGKRLLFVGGSLAAGSRQQAAGSRQDGYCGLRISVCRCQENKV